MVHSFWHQVPVIKLLLPFAAGIGLSMFYPVELELALIVWVVLFVWMIAWYLCIRRYTRQWEFGLVVSLLMLWTGLTLYRLHDVRLSDSYAANQQHTHYWVVRMDEQPVLKPSSLKISCKVLGTVDSAGIGHKACGKLLVYLNKSITTADIEYGRILWIPVSAISEVAPPQNPGEFDYKRYLSFHGIYHQAYIAKLNQLRISNTLETNPVQKGVYEVQAYVKKVLQRNIHSVNETAVAQALLYGYDDDIDAETVKAYSNTGTLHVLAVSGMHVGIIYLIMGWLLGWLTRFKRGDVIQQILIGMVLWLYSFVCGLSPSILRATVMFSFIIAGNLLKSRSNIYNTLAASAFVLLCFDPNMLANVGFQLSYLAVLGIVIFQPGLYNLFTPQWFWLDEIWKITAVSLAAQLVTFPIGLLYFHQFPNCFLFSNLIIIPLTTLILYGGLLLVAIGSLGWLAWVLGQALFGLIYATNQIVVWVEQVPYAYVNGIIIGITQTLLLYGMIGCLTVYIRAAHKIWLQLTLVLSLVWAGIWAFQQIKQQQQQKLVVYKVGHSTAVQLVSGSSGILILDTALFANDTKRRFHIQQHTWQQQIHQQQILKFENRWQQFSIGNHQILIAGNGYPNPVKHIHYLLTSRTLVLDELQFNFDCLILTSALTRKQILPMVEWCKHKGIRVYDVNAEGAFLADLSGVSH